MSLLNNLNLPKRVDSLYKWILDIQTNWLNISPNLKIAGSILLSIAVLRKINNILSREVLNNFKLDSYDWRREVVVVTGGSGGLGDLLVRKLSKRCIKVISLDIMPPKAPLPANAYFYQTEITSSKSVAETAQKIRSEHGHPTVLVNNAGVTQLSTIFEETEEQIRRTFDVNLISHFLMIKEFVPAMVKADHGHVLTLASMASFITGSRNVDYACAKVGALALHEGLTQELKHSYGAKKVRTSIIHPTYIKTPLIERVYREGKFKALLLNPEQVVDVIFNHIISGKSGQIVLPSRFAIASGLRGWPSWLQEIVRSSQQNVLDH